MESVFLFILQEVSSLFPNLRILLRFQGSIQKLPCYLSYMRIKNDLRTVGNQFEILGWNKPIVVIARKNSKLLSVSVISA